MKVNNFKADAIQGCHVLAEKKLEKNNKGETKGQFLEIFINFQRRSPYIQKYKFDSFSHYLNKLF